MTDAYIIKDDYDQTTVTVVIGAENGEVAVELAKQQGFEGEGDLYSVGPVNVINA